MLDLELNQQALETLQRGVALAREANVLFWRQRIDASLAVAQLRLGNREVGAALQSALTYSRDNGERYLMTRCLQGLAEMSLASGDAAQCLARAEELQSLGQANGLREISAIAQRWRGEALFAAKAYAAAAEAFAHVVLQSNEIGRPRLVLDAHRGLARLSKKSGDQEKLIAHRAKAHQISARIASSVQQSGIEVELVTD